MLLRWFDAREAKAFGEELARYYDAELRSIGRASASKQDDKQRKLLGRVLQRTQQFAQQHRLNVYRKAKLSNRLKWTLKDLGYDDELIDRLVKEVLLALA